ncbi:MAG: hypothetical protein A3C90_00615 [Candidatus Magasanikbacteria bacterium RIFCSPHIGHO2_02_FULL_51_14]|uniref:Response regulatory domain-containing protein n=1 Tax=Candidatus Magasanikbacteria bacterium RIFCSPHIGHO2_02_FULL_51_14 TaxID=1798683 RepID=A0A1F6MFG5_9BACT|nr:MAG: hypothetical protein A3C90_00615 [Candidatus Magasanikbacteria bacterium RIFCSPHIGHO2_02_FULL_51_14]
MSKNHTILIVEDERPLLRAIKKKFELHGFDVVTAISAKQALSYLKDIPEIEVIWLDHYLFGKGDGIDFMASIRKKNSGWQNIPVFVVSNTASSDKISSYMKLGAKDYYVKADHTLEEIVVEIKKFLGKKKM